MATEYPDFTVTGVSSRQVDYSTAAGGGSEWVFYFEMQSIERPAFAFTARYYTLVSSKADPRCYANGDSFFNPRLTPPEIASSFMRMWLFSHPGEKCLYVTLGDGWGSAARTCEVSYARFERTGTSVTSTSGAYVFNYLPDTDTWTQVAAAASPAPQEDAAVGYEFSLADTRTAVVNALPGFEAIGTATRANGDPMILVRHTKYRGLRMAVDGVFLDPPNTTLDMVDLFIGDRVKADSFARAWSSAHGGTIIDLLYFEDAGTKNTLGMTFVTSVKDVDDTRHEESTQYHYDSKTHVWTEMK